MSTLVVARFLEYKVEIKSLSNVILRTKINTSLIFGYVLEDIMSNIIHKFYIKQKLKF